MIGRSLLITLIVLGLSACEGAIHNPRAHHAYQEYLAKPHFRAFAITGGNPNLSFAWGSAWRNSTVEGALEKALESCNKGVKQYSTRSQCEIYAIGDMMVVNLSEEQTNKAIELYKINRSATNENLENLD